MPNKKLVFLQIGQKNHDAVPFAGAKLSGEMAQDLVFAVAAIYALDKPSDLKPSISKKQFADAMKGHVPPRWQLTGIYQRELS